VIEWTRSGFAPLPRGGFPFISERRDVEVRARARALVRNLNIVSPFSPTTLSDDPRDGSSNKSVDKPLDSFYVNIAEAPRKTPSTENRAPDVPLRNPPRKFLLALGFIKARATCAGLRLDSAPTFDSASTSDRT